MDKISFKDFLKIDLRVGTIVDASDFTEAIKPAYKLKIDFGDLGVLNSSAQITHYYSKENLVGKQVIGVCNFPTKNIAGVVSEVLILGAIEKDGKVVLVHPSQKAENGLDIA